VLCVAWAVAAALGPRTAPSRAKERAVLRMAISVVRPF
jgi:hypothetical protein